MSGIVRFGMSLEKDLLHRFNVYMKQKGYGNRSEAIRDLIREALIKREWQEGKEVTGAITLVYNHHKRELLTHLTGVQHEYHDNILSTQHVHLDEDNCLEIIVVKGKPKKVEELYGKLKSMKGVKHAGISMSTTGREIV